MMERTSTCKAPWPLAGLVCASLLTALVPLAAHGSAAAGGDGGVTFHDFAAQKGSGIEYRRTPSRTFDLQKKFESLPAVTMSQVIAGPEKPRGAPGVALLDFDRDGDLDIYVTNGPGSANSLYSNQLMETGRLGFHDVARSAGVEATAQDSTGVCFGDTDNDGDPDLLVLGRMEPNRFFENLGNGSFREAGEPSGLGGGRYGHSSCSFGDIDNDGLLDVAVANSFDWTTRPAVFTVPYALNHPNQLFRNLGKNRFEDVSESSGIRDLRSVQPPIEEGATLTWSVVLVDYDQDGDLDLFHADDQAALPPNVAVRAPVHLLVNDGEGHFTDFTTGAGTNSLGDWMGLTFGDFNCDDRLDLFAANLGDYAFSALHIPFEQGQWSSRWFLGRAGGGFDDPGVGELRATPFGWSPMALDYDNDGDTDVIYLGALGTAVYFIMADNPGVVLQNRGCAARFALDREAMTTVHNRRVVEGAAAGDLDGNGFPDVVSVSSFDIPEEVPQVPYGLDYDSPFDRTAVYFKFMEPAPGGSYIPNGIEFPNGRLVVDLNSGGNGNHWISVKVLGTVGLTHRGRVNRDGIGALIRLQPEGLDTHSLRPVMGGSNYASQDALEMTLGLGSAARGTVEVRWPSGVRNRLYGVEAGERVLMPEIPCSFEASWPSEAAYRGCVEKALGDLRNAKVISAEQRERLLESALTAYRDADRGVQLP
jgi:hypothetical protein